MKEKSRIAQKGYAVIRCHDGVIVARLQSFPECERALMYRRGSMVSFMPLQDNEIIGTPLRYLLRCWKGLVIALPRILLHSRHRPEQPIPAAPLEKSPMAQDQFKQSHIPTLTNASDFLLPHPEVRYEEKLVSTYPTSPLSRLDELEARYHAKQIKTERSLDNDFIHWTISAFLPEVSKPPRQDRTPQQRFWR